jgi:hypothetical protein
MFERLSYPFKENLEAGLENMMAEIDICKCEIY